MGFERNYDALLQLASVLGQYDGYLDTEDQKAFQLAKQNYATERNKVAYDILAEKPDLDLVFERIRGDLQQCHEEDGWPEDLCSFIADDLIDKLTEESSKSPLRRTAVRYGGAAVLAILVLGWGGMFLYKDIDLDQPIETQEGLAQHAAAYMKARDYDDMMSTRTRRGGAIKGILLKPWEPDEQELEAANGFVSLVFDGLALLTQQGVACNTEYTLMSEEISESDFAMLDRVAETLQSDNVVWEDPAVMTVLPLLQESYPCAAASPIEPPAPQ